MRVVRTTGDRRRHAIAFEVLGLALCVPLAVWVFDLQVHEAGPLTLGLLVMTLPLIAWWLSISLLGVLIVDLGLVVFYLVYAFLYNWAYDHLFAPPALGPRRRQGNTDSIPPP